MLTRRVVGDSPNDDGARHTHVEMEPGYVYVQIDCVCPFDGLTSFEIERRAQLRGDSKDHPLGHVALRGDGVGGGGDRDIFMLIQTTRFEQPCVVNNMTPQPDGKAAQLRLALVGYLDDGLAPVAGRQG